MDAEKLRAAVNRSGFPLQIKAASVINQSREQHGWRVLHSEHAWQSPSERQSGFIDLVLVDRNGTSVMVMECKRVMETEWIFLLPDDAPPSRRQCKAWAIHSSASAIYDHGWIDLSIDPATAESAFCIVDGQDPKARPLLERLASELVTATESFAFEERQLHDYSKPFTRIYTNVILTTAQLKLCRFSVEDISLSDGTIRKASFAEAPYLRFRKQLSTDSPPVRLSEDPLRVGTIARAKENTVFVVNADHLLDFLAAIEVTETSLERLTRP